MQTVLHLRILTFTLLLLVVSTKGYAQVTADFTMSTVASCSPATIYFSNSSLGAVKASSWELGNGTSSNFTDASAIYVSPGLYSVKLTVTDNNGNTDDVIKQVEIYANPKARITSNLTSVCERDEVSFSDISILGDTAIAAWVWDFGDGSVSNNKNPKYAYQNNGQYTLRLAVTDRNGCVGDTTIPNYLRVKEKPEPQFNFNAARVCRPPVSVSFNNTTAPTGNSFVWKFSDGTVSIASNPNKFFTAFGSYDVQLIATNVSGCKDSITVKDDILIAPLSVDFTWPSTALCEGSEITFTQNCTPQLTTPTIYRWIFPDGVIKTGRSVKHRLSSGNQNVTLQVVNAQCEKSSTKEVIINAPLEKNIVLSDSVLCGARQFLYYSFDDTGIDNFRWDMNGEGKSTLSNAVLLDKEGEHYINLYMKDTNGCETTLYDTIYQSIPTLSLSRDTGGCMPYSVASSLAVSGLYGVDSVIWDLQSFKQGRLSGYSTPSFALPDTGAFIVDVRVYDSIGCIFTRSRLIEGGFVPVASFTIDTNTLCNRQGLTLTSTSNMPYQPTEYSWSVAGNTANTPVWTPVFKEIPRKYLVSHRVAHYGCWDQADKIDSINILGPYVNFDLSSDRCSDAYKEVRTIVLDADSFSYFLNNAYLGSDTTFERNFTHGDTLKVIATNGSTGCIDSLVSVVEVNDDALVDWEVSASTCAPALIEIKRNVAGVDSFKWKYDGNFVAHQEAVFRTTASGGGDIPISLVGYLGENCILQLDTVIRVAGPRVEAKVGRSFGCYPVDLRLIDSFWNDPSDSRIWVIDGDTIPSDTLITTYQVKGLKNVQDNLLVIKMIASEDSCSSMKQYNYAYPTIKFKTRYSDTVTSCTTANYTFRLNVAPNELSDVRVYRFEYDGNIVESTDSIFSQAMELDGSLDTVYLSVESMSGCLATQKVVIQKGLPTLNARFSAGNTQAACPPLMVNFKDESVSKLGNITTTEWFIDGAPFSVFTNPSRVFSEPGAYDVKLVVRDDQGCTDSLSIDSFVTLLGEKVDVDFGPSMVCDGQLNEFKVLQGNASVYEWDMGDGTVLKGDSVAYTYSDTGSYQLRLLVSDASCKYPLVNDLQTQVLPKPAIDFSWTKSCPLLPTDFINLSTTSTPVVKLDWSVGSDSYLNRETFSHILGATDELVKLVVTDSLGCQDSLETKVKIYPVTVDFALDKEYYCLGDSIRITSQTVSDTAINTVLTYFNNILESTQNSPVLSADIDGYIDVKMIATNAANCSDTISKSSVLKIAGPNTLSNAALTYISVGESNEIFANWEVDTTGLFEKYELLDGSNTIVWESSIATEQSTTLFRLNPEQSTVCLTLQVENGCNTPPSRENHCTVHTTSESISMARKVNWTPYIGWDQVDGYSIYREDDEGYQLIGSVSGAEFSYVDSVHVNCDEVQKYKVAAYGPHISYSDTCHVKPVWDYALEAPWVSNITVAFNKRIEIVIDTMQEPDIDLQEFRIKRTDLLGNTLEWNTDLGSIIYDDNVDVSSQRYTYSISQTDQCETQSEPARDVSSILLQVENDITNYPKITWTKEQAWERGFTNYQLYKVRETEMGYRFTKIADITEREDTTFIDKSLDIECTESACYMVEAINRDIVTSKSNLNCGGLESRIYAPNAVTPNGDGLNDTYSARGLYIAQYSLEVYTRWGEKIFETDECMQPWDGTVKGEKAPAGVYFYVISATGADRVRHNLKGSLTVLR